MTRAAHDGLGPGAEVEISIRPESIELVPADAAGRHPRAQVEQAAYLGTNLSYQVRTAGGLVLSVLAPKTGPRLPVGSEVAVTWSAVRGARPRRHGRGGPSDEEEQS